MERYFRVKEGTEAWKLFHQLWSQHTLWEAARPEIEALLGCNMNGIVKMHVASLAVSEIPPALAKEFKTTLERGSFFLKKKSKLHAAWADICARYKLTDLTVGLINFHLGTAYGQRSIDRSYPPIDGVYYFADKGKESYALSTQPTWEETDWVEPVAEPIFLRLWADHLEKTQQQDARE